MQSFQGWTLDQEFAAQLDKGWNLEKARDATYKALAAAGRERMHFRPPEEQNDHKVTCGVRADVVDKVIVGRSSSHCPSCRIAFHAACSCSTFLGAAYKHHVLASS